MPRRKTRRPSRPVRIGRTITVTWNQVFTEVYVAMDEPKRGQARVESWSITTAFEDDAWV